MSETPTQAFRAARDFLIARRGQHDAAVAGFRWPQLQRFNWALDWFDVLAQGNHATALALARRQGVNAALECFA